MSNVIAIKTDISPRTRYILEKWNKVIAFFPNNRDIHAIAVKLIQEHPSATIRQLLDVLNKIAEKRKDN
ncbi:aerobic ribonucleoside diphosphate reductase large subunit [Proteus phage VTCCBPA139]|nr:aerobic ribonucleoside diphosphate reductase large subunit [Proteus phage VTCCBPA139]